MPSFVQANGLRFACVEQGTGPLVLLLHGFPDTPQTWDAVLPAVAASGFRAVAPFMRGYAPTEVAGPYDGDTLGRDALALIEALGEQRAVVVGHDWGASAAIAAAALAPERVQLLVTVALPHPAAILPTPRMIWLGRHFLSFQRRGAADMVRANGFAHVDELVQRWSPAWKVPPGETQAVKRVFSDPASLEAALGYYRAVRLRPPRSWRSPIAVPAVSFAGTDDPVPLGVYDRAARWFTQGYEVVRMPGGHFLHREHPQRFIAELLRVLQRPPPGPARTDHRSPGTAASTP